MTPTKLLVGQIFIVFAIVILGLWAATQWAAAMLGYQAQLGQPWAILWTYPQDRFVALQRQNARAEQARPIAEGMTLANLRFSYAITGDNPPWRPVRAWDDGSKVYIEFPARLDQGEAPPLFVVGPLGQSQLVNYRVSGNHYIVDRLFGAAELRLGENPQAVVGISRSDGEKGRARP